MEKKQQLSKKRIKEILKWIEKNEALIVSSHCVKLNLHIKGLNVTGEIINLPDIKP